MYIIPRCNLCYHSQLKIKWQMLSPICGLHTCSHSSTLEKRLGPPRQPPYTNCSQRPLASLKYTLGWISWHGPGSTGYRHTSGNHGVVSDVINPLLAHCRAKGQSTTGLGWGYVVVLDSPSMDRWMFFFLYRVHKHLRYFYFCEWTRKWWIVSIAIIPVKEACSQQARGVCNVVTSTMTF